MKGTDATAKRRLGLGYAIRRRRMGLALSQEKLAELTGCHRNYVGKVERGEQNLTVDMLWRFADALDCKADEFVGTPAE